MSYDFGSLLFHEERYFQDFVGELELSMDEAHLPLYENIRLFKDGDEVK